MEASILEILTAIVLIGNFLLAIERIYIYLIKKPSVKVDEAKKQEFKKNFQECFDTIATPYFERIESRMKETEDKVDVLIESSKDTLRVEILKIYGDNKKSKTLTYHDHENLEQFYHDYKAERGNSYIDKYYDRMKNWEIIDDFYDDDKN